MADTLVLSVEGARVAFGNKVIFDDLTFHILERDRIALVGKNGTGKTTLMRLVTGELDMDDGKRFHLQGTKIGYLAQDVVPKVGQTVQEYVFEGLADADDKDAVTYKVEQIVEPLHLRPHDLMTQLSGGQLRRAALARALVNHPDILLLDEPTNHLDLDVIEWLEVYLRNYQGALLCISHDKTFLANITNKIFWLDRGNLKVAPKGFGYFDEWSETLYEQEARELQNRKKQVELEVEWASRGVKARRKRNQKRLENMKVAREKLKRDLSSYRRATAKIEWDAVDVEVTSKVVAEFYKVNKSFGDRTILEDFSLKIIRGDRIGILGRNGSGKTTFLKMLVGELLPDMGTVKRSRELEFSYFDQARKDLRPDWSLWRTLCPDGGDHINVMGKWRHVIGYLKDFLFDPDMAQQAVANLSGGQKNRLLLAKVLADPKSFMILDEPTNDLDMDTLDMLEDVLNQYQGTLVVVSHDRDFLDQTVTKILAFEGDGEVEGYIGGYSDYLANRRSPKTASAAPASELPEPVAQPIETRTLKSDKISFKVRHEWKTLPETIARLETEVADLRAKLADGNFYNADKDAFYAASKRLPVAAQELETAEFRWLELEELLGDGL